MTAAYIMLAMMLAMFFSGLLAGGQFGRLDETKWDVLIPWPAVWIPAWLVIVVCLMPPIAALILAPKAHWEQLPEFISMTAFTVVLFALLPIMFSRMYADNGGPGTNGGAGAEFSAHWFGALPQILTVIVLVVRQAMLTPAYNAAVRRSRENFR